MINVNADQGQPSRTFTFSVDLVHWHARAFEKYLEEHGNGRLEGSFKVYDLPNECREIFEKVWSIFVHGKIPDGLPGLRISKLNLLVEIYAAANRLRLNTAMNVVIYAFHVDVNSNALFPSTLVIAIWEKTERESLLRRWFLEQLTISMETDDFEEFSGYWPAEALLDLAMFCHARYDPPLKLEDPSKFYRTSFATHSDFQ